ncbi:MAG: eL32 family ribosomal protein [Candidatus Woesearchaeota archaeon]
MKKFTRKDENKKKRIAGGGWRRPKGITNKMRLNRKGHTPNVRPGYGSDIKSKNTFDGLDIVTVFTVDELLSLNPKVHCVVLGRVGKQKKLDMIKKADELKLKIVNLKVDAFKKGVEDFFAERAKASKEKLEALKKKEAELAKAEKDKVDAKKAEKEKADAKNSEDNKSASKKVVDGSEDELSDDKKAKAEKQEKDKILTKK